MATKLTDARRKSRQEDALRLRAKGKINKAAALLNEAADLMVQSGNIYFPNRFNSSEVREIYNKLIVVIENSPF